ncbi:vanin-like protein 3 [Drosophila grimshawi]|uniref:GH24840 n=1 Tax=Drosophila grimshawi TaxID=7222 RepID=B4JNL1_DROGR|nr:vanin-like protein 3 [Drosophila grimshawi]EDV92304.1 GH24840 [Drosophila grimshawi]
MSGKWLPTLLQLLCFAVSSCRALSTPQYYTAGVIEFRPAFGAGTSEQLLEQNLAAYLELIASANGTADILVFPEGTLNSQLQLTVVPAPSKRSLCHVVVAPADGVARFLRQLACAAVEAHSYLLLNVNERERCDPLTDKDCPARGYNVYNTNVVLDRSGAVVSRYRKWNLYLEPHLNRTRQPEYAVFETDFNVTFGHFICFDMLFYTPAQELVERYNLRNLIVSKMFKSELPFLTASQLQQGWAWANGVNLLAAGASLPHGGISGSGIYAGEHGALKRLMVGSNATVGERQLLLARVPHSPLVESSDVQLDEERVGPAQRSLAMLQQPLLDKFNSWRVPSSLAGSLQQKHICQADLCCHFEWQLATSPRTERLPEYVYRLGVFVGQRRYEEAQYSVVRLCGLFACRNDSISSCGQLTETPTAAVQFNILRINGNFVHRPRRLLMPSTLSASLYALQSSEIEWQQHVDSDNKSHVQLQLRKPHAQLLTFAIYGNYFDETLQPGGGGDGDGDGDGGAAATAVKGVSVLQVLLLLLVLLLTNVLSGG